MENKYLEWINAATDLESDRGLLEEFVRWIEHPYPRAMVQLTAREGWESLALDWKTVLH